ncbi:FtsH protease activity modulator HflK, partial [bacterium]|nr:FtsH protease activity modulator HflK [bacterium]
MHLSRFTLIAAGVVLGIYLLFGFYTIASDQMGVVTMFGKVINDRVSPGIHYRLPWPFTSVQKPQVTAIRRMSIGFKLAEQMQGMRPSREERERLSGDWNVITVSLMVQYTVRDPAQYLFKTEGPDFLLRKVGEALICEKVGRFPVDEMLTVGKFEVEQYVRSGLQAFVDQVDAGILIRSCNLQKVEPPAEVIESFNEVSRAKANREKVINEAHAYQSELLPRARAEAQQIKQLAEAQARERIRQAAGEVERFEKLLTEYRRNPEVLKQRL